MKYRMRAFWSLAAVAGLVWSATAILAADPPLAGESVELPMPGTLLWADAPLPAAPAPVVAAPRPVEVKSIDPRPGFFARLFGRSAASGTASTVATKAPLAD